LYVCFQKKQFLKQGNPTMKDATLKQIATQLGLYNDRFQGSKDYPDVSKKN
jgi:hypothetical protein